MFSSCTSLAGSTCWLSSGTEVRWGKWIGWGANSLIGLKPFSVLKEDTYIFIACSRRSDSRARRSVGSELNCTPVPETGVGGGGVSPRLFYVVNFSTSLYHLNAWNNLLSTGRHAPFERLEQADIFSPCLSLCLLIWWCFFNQLVNSTSTVTGNVETVGQQRVHS